MFTRQRLVMLFMMMALGCSLILGAVGKAMGQEWLKWSELPQLPPAPGQEKQVGLAGPFVGVDNGVLIVAGGANFPEAPPWEGGKKVWWDDIFVLEKREDDKHQWITDEKFEIPRPLAYGVSINTEEGILCIGGCDAEECYKDVFLLKWNPAVKKVEIESMPPLPRPLAFMSGAMVGKIIYVSGGQEAVKNSRATKNFWMLDLSKKDDKAAFKWKELSPWPDPARIVPISVTQSDGTDDCFYLLSGRNVAPHIDTELLRDAYSYNPKTCEWKRLAQLPHCVMAGTGIASGANHILVFGGADGKIFLQLERLDREIRKAKQAGDKSRVDALTKELHRIHDTHPGFSRDILAYHTITDTWVKVGELPTTSQVTTTAVKWGKSIVIPCGEIRPGVRTPKIWKAEVHAMPREFGWINYSVLGIYLLALVAMGVYFSKRQKTTDDFFKAGHRVPWWAAGLSIFGTQLSALTFMAIPAKTFATDWRYFLGNMAIIMVAPFIVFFFLPFYRRLKVTTAYEYLEKRFNLATRLLGSTMYMLFQLTRLGIVLFLPSLALSVVTGVNLNLCIILMGLLCVLYTVLGGIEAVIWTDVMQAIVLMGGALLCLVLIPFHIQGGWNAMNDIADAANKLRLLDFRFYITTPTFWVMVLGGMGANLISYGTDQTVIQRYLTTKDEKSAARSIWTNAIFCIPSSLIFFGLGTALFAFYKSHPQMLDPTLYGSDAIFPLYIVTQLPVGVAGLLIAGLFAAAMSTLDSSMNSVSAAFTTDFYRRFRPKVHEHTYLTVARLGTAIIGLLGTSFALMLARGGFKSLWDQYCTFLGLFAGGLGGLFILAIFSRCTHGFGAIVGILGSGVVQFAIQRWYPVHAWFYAVTGIVSCFAIGYLASLIIPAKKKPLDGVTIYTLPQRVD